MPRFFVNQNNILSDKIIIDGEDVAHIKKVLRFDIGDILTLCDAAGTDYQVRIEFLDKEQIHTGILSKNRNATEPPIEIVLLQGLPKHDKMEFIIQKGVELGVSSIIPVLTERTIVKLGDVHDIKKRVDRWQKISLEAAKQSERGIVPTIYAPLPLGEAVQYNQNQDIKMILYEKEKTNKLKDHLIVNAKKISMLIGPEGGFTDQEVEIARLQGFCPVTCGPRILRTETASIVMTSILMYELGDVGR